MSAIIQHSRIMAVEGKDEVHFFSCLLNYMGQDDIEVFDVGGTVQFNDKFPALVRRSGFNSKVKKMAIIRDAEDNAENAFQSIKNILIKENITPPEKPNQFSIGKPNVGIFIMPGDFENGMLEDLCLRTVKDHPAVKCVDVFIECVSKLENPPRNIAKSKAQAFLAAMPDIVSSVGLGAEKRYWDFSSDELKKLKNFLSDFV
jgi:hypothetical protein